MALDTAAKRRSVPGVGRPWLRSHLNDASAGSAWRINSGNAYAGVTLAAPAAATSGGTWFKYRSPVRPSWKSGLAKAQSQSAYPDLWRELKGAWIPALGSTGSSLKNMVSRYPDLTLVNMAGTNWGASKPGHYVSFNGTDEIAGTADNIQGYGINANEAGMTLHVAMRTSVSGSIVYSMSISSDTVTNLQATIGIKDTGEAMYRVRTQSPFSEALSSRAYEVGQWASVTGVSRSVSDRSVYLNGAAEGTNTDTLSVMTGADSAALGGLLDYNPTYSQCDVAVAYYWKRALSQNEIQLIARDPLAPFRQWVRLPLNVGEKLYDTFCLKEWQVYSPGAAAAQIYTPGMTAEIYQPGVSEFQVGC